MALTPLLTLTLAENGAILATTIGFAVACIGNIWVVWRKTSWRISSLGQELILILIATLLMGITVYLLQGLLIGRVHELYQLLLGTFVGIMLYIALTYKLPWVQALSGRVTKKIAKQ